MRVDHVNERVVDNVTCCPENPRQAKKYPLDLVALQSRVTLVTPFWTGQRVTGRCRNRDGEHVM